MAIRVLHIRKFITYAIFPLLFVIVVLAFVAFRKYKVNDIAFARLRELESMQSSLQAHYDNLNKSVASVVAVHYDFMTNTLPRVLLRSSPSSMPPPASDIDLFSVPTNAIYAAYNVAVADGVPYVCVFGICLYPNCVFRGVRVLSVDSERIVFANGQVIINSGVHDVPQD